MMLPYSQHLFMTFESGAKQRHVTLLIFKVIERGLLILSLIIATLINVPKSAKIMLLTG